MLKDVSHPICCIGNGNIFWRAMIGADIAFSRHNYGRVLLASKSQYRFVRR